MSITGGLITTLAFLFVLSPLWAQQAQKPLLKPVPTQPAIPEACREPDHNVTGWIALEDKHQDPLTSLDPQGFELYDVASYSQACGDQALERHLYQLAARAYRLSSRADHLFWVTDSEFWKATNGDLAKQHDQEVENVIEQHNRDIDNMAARYNELAKDYNALANSAEGYTATSKSLISSYQTYVRSLEEEIRTLGIQLTQVQQQTQAETQRARLVRDLDQATRAILPSAGLIVTPPQEIRCMGNSTATVGLPAVSRVYLICR